MGAPRRNRSKFEKPKEIWNLERITSDKELRGEYGLKNMKELWKVQSNISRIRGNVRELLSGSAHNEEDESRIIASLAKQGITSGTVTLDDILDIKESAFLERRLQSMVYRKGLARSMRQARQLITHGFIAINGRKVSRPGYIVNAVEEQQISYYRKIDITVKEPEQPSPASEGAEEEAARKAEVKPGEESGAAAKESGEPEPPKEEGKAETAKAEKAEEGNETNAGVKGSDAAANTGADEGSAAAEEKKD